MNPLDKYPSVRSALYMVQWVANGILTIAGVVFVTLGRDLDKLPEWYVLALAIAPVLWTYLGMTAQANTPSAQDVADGNAPMPPPDRGAADVVTILLVAVLVVVLLILLGVNFR
jgi:hypothetical protein